MQNFFQDDTSFSDTEDSQHTKFDLYLKVREISQIYTLLQQVLHKKKSEQKVWAKENQEMVENMMDSFMNESVLVLDGMQLDEESMQLSIDLMEKLRFTLTAVQDLLPLRTLKRK